jgi:hypothetical protein
MSGAAYVDGVEGARLDDAVEVHVNEVQAGGRAPMTEQPRLDVGELERTLEQGIVEQVNLPDRKVVRRAPPGIHQLELRGRQRLRGGTACIVAGHSIFP